jgi:Uma2 family endonuclease
MSTLTTSQLMTSPREMLLPTDWTLAELQKHLGGIPLRRIRLYPAPGTASEDDALDIAAHEKRLCELVDGVLVEKDMGSWESLLAGFLIQQLNNFVDQHPLGIVLGPDGPLRILPKRMRIPDVSFIRWERFGTRKVPQEPVFRVVPDLAIEVLSKGNTRREMELKHQEYFQAGVRLVWYIDPRTRSATVHTAPDQIETLDENGLLEGRDVLPGFQVRLGDLLDRVPREKK